MSDHLLAFLESLAPEGERLLIGKAVKLEDGSTGYVPTETLPPNTALYANTGSFIKARAEGGMIRAKIENMEHCLFLMCDDVGTKSKAPPLEPTWKIETSPGNYQWGYAYSERPTKGEQSAAVRAIAAAGFSDPGASGPVRWCRIPGSLNKKKQFTAKLTEFHPDRLFKLADILAAMGVTPDAPEADRTPAKIKDDGEDDVLAWLVARGDVIDAHPTADGCYEVRCPAAHEHSDGRAGAGYWPATRGFKCQHSHGDQWKSVDFLKWVASQGGPEHSYGPRPELLFKAAEQSSEAEAADILEHSRRYMNQLFAANGLNAADYSHVTAPLPTGDTGTFLLKLGESRTVEYREGEGRVRGFGSPCPAFFGNCTGARVIFVSDDWFTAAALHAAIDVPVICVEDWAFGEIVTEDGESARELHTDLMGVLSPSVEVRIVTVNDASHDHRKRLATLRVLIMEEGAKVKVFALPTEDSTFGALSCRVWPEGAPDPSEINARLFKGKDALLIPIPDEELADAANSYMMSNAERFGNFYLDLTDRGAGSYILSKLGRGAFYYLVDRNMWVRWRGGEWHDEGKEPLQLVNVAAHGYMHRGAVIRKQVDALLEEIERLKALKKPKDPKVKQQLAECGGLLDEKMDEMERLANRAKVLSQSNGRAAVLKDLKSRPDVAIKSSRFDNNPDVLGVANGVVELKTGVLRPVSQEDMMLRRCPVAYRAGAEHPKVKALLREITAHDYLNPGPKWMGGDGGDGGRAVFNEAPDRLSYLKRRMGAAMFGSNVLTSLEILHGVGSNGKTVLANAMEAALGDSGEGGYAARAPAGLFMSRQHSRDPEASTPTLNRVQGARMLFMAETKDTDYLDEQFVKTTTGGDKMVSRANYADPTTTRPTYTPILLTNPLPAISEGGKALWDRLAPFHFKCRWLRANNTEPADQQLIPEDTWFKEDVLRDHGALEAVLAWLIEGSMEFSQNGLGKVPADVLVEISSYKSDNDVYGEWMNANGWVFKKDEETTLNELYLSYCNFCSQTGRKQPRAKIFSKRLYTAFPSLTRRELDGRVVVIGIKRAWGLPTLG